MELLLICFVVITINSIMFIVYQQKAFFINSYNNFYTMLIIMGQCLKSQYVIEHRDNNNSKLVFGLFGVSRKENEIIKAERLKDLCLEKAKLNNKLKMLEYITLFELYLNQNNIDNEKFNQFSELKLLTQESILESTRKVSYLNAA